MPANCQLLFSILYISLFIYHMLYHIVVYSIGGYMYFGIGLILFFFFLIVFDSFCRLVAFGGFWLLVAFGGFCGEGDFKGYFLFSGFFFCF